MLSSKAKKILKSSAKFANITGGMPFGWDSRNEGLRVTSKSLYRWRFVAVYQLIYTSFILTNIIISRNSVSFISQQRAIAMCVANLAFLLFHAQYKTRQQETLACVNLFLAFANYFESTYAHRIVKVLIVFLKLFEM